MEPPDLTQLLASAAAGERAAVDQLLPLVYADLRRMAEARMAAEKPGHTLQATALVHEAYVRLVGGDRPVTFHSQFQFFAAAAEAMRRIMVDQARRKATAKHGGGRSPIDLDLVPAAESDLITLDEALTAFEAAEPEKAQLIKLRFFAGLSIEDAAATLGISPATAKRQWAFSRAWLFAKMTGDEKAETA